MTKLNSRYGLLQATRQHYGLPPAPIHRRWLDVGYWERIYAMGDMHSRKEQKRA